VETNYELQNVVQIIYAQIISINIVIFLHFSVTIECLPWSEKKFRAIHSFNLIYYILSMMFLDPKEYTRSYIFLKVYQA